MYALRASVPWQRTHQVGLKVGDIRSSEATAGRHERIRARDRRPRRSRKIGERVSARQPTQSRGHDGRSNNPKTHPILLTRQLMHLCVRTCAQCAPSPRLASAASLRPSIKARSIPLAGASVHASYYGEMSSDFESLTQSTFVQQVRSAVPTHRTASCRIIPRRSVHQYRTSREDCIWRQSMIARCSLIGRDASSSYCALLSSSR